MPQQYYQQQPEPQEMDYEDIEHYEDTRRSGRHKPYGSSGGRLPNMEYDYDESDECKCSCNRCKDTRKPPKPCCKETCFSCSDMQSQQGQGGLFFVPYPYPLMIPNMMNASATSSVKPTITTTTVKPSSTTVKRANLVILDQNSSEIFLERSYNSKRQRKSSAENINDIILRSPYNLKGDRKYMLTSVRKTKPTWEPKYGIVPIPDKLAEKLMSQLRQVRELQARRF